MGLFRVVAFAAFIGTAFAPSVFAGDGMTPAEAAKDPVLRQLMLRIAQAPLPEVPVAPSPDTAAPPAGPQQVTVGIYPTTVYELDVGNSTFQATAYVWFRWKGENDPTETMELVNAVENWGLTQENLLEEPEQLEDGSLYQIVKVQGRFFQAFSLAKFPLDTQTLSITVEDSTHPIDQMVYVADTDNSGKDDRLRVPGWQLRQGAIETGSHTYSSNFGEDGESPEYATATFSLGIERPHNYFYLKMLLPLIIVLVANWTVFLIQPRLIEVRTALPTTALLTTMFMQQSYSSALPEIGYLVLLDKIYVVAYALIILTLIAVIVSSRRIKTDTDGAELLPHDRSLLILQVAIFAAATVALVVTR